MLDIFIKIYLLGDVFGSWRSIFLFRKVARYLGSNRKHSFKLEMTFDNNLINRLHLLFLILLLVLLGESWWKQTRLGFAWVTRLDIRCAFKITLILGGLITLSSEIMVAALVNFSRPSPKIGPWLVLVFQFVYVLGHSFGYFFESLMNSFLKTPFDYGTNINTKIAPRVSRQHFKWYRDPRVHLVHRDFLSRAPLRRYDYPFSRLTEIYRWRRKSKKYLHWDDPWYELPLWSCRGFKLTRCCGRQPSDPFQRPRRFATQ